MESYYTAMMAVDSDHTDFARLLMKGVFGNDARNMRCNDCSDPRTKKFPDNFPDSAKAVYRQWLNLKKKVVNGVEVAKYGDADLEKLVSSFPRSLSDSAKNMDGVRGQARVVKIAKQSGEDVQAAVAAYRVSLEEKGEARARKAAKLKGLDEEAAVAAYKEKAANRKRKDSGSDLSVPGKRNYVKRGSTPLVQKQLTAPSSPLARSTLQLPLSSASSTRATPLQPAIQSVSKEPSTNSWANESWQNDNLRDAVLPPGPTGSMPPIRQALDAVNNVDENLISF